MAARAIAAFILLTLAGFNGLIAFSVDTCTQNAPDSLIGFIFTLPLNLAGMALLAWNPKRLAVALAAIIPALLALPYTMGTIELLSGAPACTVLTGETTWEPSGEEGLFKAAWGACVLIFWLGLAYALLGGYRPRYDRDAENFA